MPAKTATKRRASTAGTVVPKKPLWDLYRDGLTQSSIKLFLQCPHQFYLRYVEGWTPRVSGDVYEFGLAFHAIDATVCSNGSSIAEETAAYLENCKRTRRLSQADTASLEETVGLAEVTLEGYHVQWSKEKIEWEAREESFRVDSPPISTYFGGMVVPLRGCWDGVIRKGKKPPRFDLFETKTKGRIDEDGIASTLALDLQTMLYSLQSNDATARRRSPSFTTWFARRHFAASKANPSRTSCNERETTSPNGPVGTTCDGIPAWRRATWNSGLLRVLVPILGRIVEWWHGFHAGESPFANPAHYINTEALFTTFGGRSDYFDLITKGSTWNLIRRRTCFPELAG